MGEGLLQKKKKRGEKNAFEQQPRNTFTNYQCAGHVHNHNIVKRQRPIQQLKRIEIEIQSREIYSLDCDKNLLKNWGPLYDETSTSKQKRFNKGDVVGAITTKAYTN